MNNAFTQCMWHKRHKHLFMVSYMKTFFLKFFCCPKIYCSYISPQGHITSSQRKWRLTQLFSLKLGIFRMRSLENTQNWIKMERFSFKFKIISDKVLIIYSNSVKIWIKFNFFLLWLQFQYKMIRIMTHSKLLWISVQPI